MSEAQSADIAPSGKCRYMQAAYPGLTAADTCSEHRHDEFTFALARGLAVVCQQPEPTDEQIGWLMDDAAAVVDDFDPKPETWTVTKPEITNEVGLDFTLTINGIDYVIQQSEWEPSHPLRRTTWDEWQAEAEGNA